MNIAEMLRCCINGNFLSVIVAGLLLMAGGGVTLAAQKQPPLPVPETVTVVELGSKTCAPCVALLPMLRELQQEYQGRVAFVLIDLWDYPDAAYTRGIKQIPAFLFYDRQGREVHRQEGPMTRAEIVDELTKVLL